ncbi:hypothetical protein HYX15_00455 [Candidatus Woesearchaeota archaeon]|nr:hypothetical protein [Candidatus Woesearchaeota archaeon]
MAEIEVVNEVPITMAQMKKKLEEIKKRDKELNFRAKKVEEYLDQFLTKDKKQEDLRKKITDLNISRLRDRQITKILDLMPKDIESLKIIFSGDNVTIKQEDLEKILQAVKE